MRVYTADEYRELDLDDEGPFVLVSNPHQNYYKTRRKASTNQQYKILMAANHITAGIDDFNPPDTSAESTAAWGATTPTKASWHAVLDSDSIIPCLPDEYTAWAQGVSGYEFNRTGLGLEIGAKSPDWNAKPDWWVEATIRNAAIWWAPRFIKYELPVRYVTSRDEVAAMLRRGEPVGFTDHWILDPNNRNDPGRHGGKNTFPREMLMQYTQEEISRRLGPPPAPPGRSGSVFFLGATGADVYEWQASLQRLGYLNHEPTGTFAQLTDEATREFQRLNGLGVDGRVGPASRQKMEGVLSLLSNRIEGPNRYATAVEVSKVAYPNGSDAVFLVDGVSLVDGIAASELVGSKLLVRPNSNNLPAGVAAEVARLKPTRVVAVGGGVTDGALHAAQVAAGLTNGSR